MTAAPPVPDGTRTRARSLARTAIAIVVTAVIIAGVWAGVASFTPQRAGASDAVAVVPVVDRESAEVAALAGLRRSALASAMPLRAAVRDLDGFSDAALVAEIVASFETLDAAIADGDATAVRDAVGLVEAARPAFVERLVADAEARIAAASSADPGLLQAARDAAGAVRSASPDELADRFAPMRAAVDAASASHAQAIEVQAAAERAEAEAEAEAREGDADDDGGGEASDGGSGVTEPVTGGNCPDGAPSYMCEPPPVVTALGAYVGDCPAGTSSHVFLTELRSGPVTLDYPFDYTYSVMDSNGLSVFHCDPDGSDWSMPHGPGPLPSP